MQSDAAVGPHRQSDLRQEALQENERGFIPDPAAGFVTLGDESIDTDRFSDLRVLQARGLQKRDDFLLAQETNVFLQLLGSTDVKMTVLRLSGRSVITGSEATPAYRR